MLARLLAATVALLTTASSVNADLGDCSQPLSSGATPVTRDCLFILRTAVSLQTCFPACVCDVAANRVISTSDALACLKIAVGAPTSASCVAQCGNKELESDRLDSARASIDHLVEVMDRYHRNFGVYDDIGSPANHFVAYGKIKDEDAPVSMYGSDSEIVDSGASSIRCTYEPASVYGGYYFLNGVLLEGKSAPAVNFGEFPDAGYDLSGAERLCFSHRGKKGGEAIEFFVAGVGHNQLVDFPESSPRIPPMGSPPFTLTTQWKRDCFSLAGMDLSYVLGGFGWVAALDGNPDGAEFYLDDIEFELSTAAAGIRLQSPRFLRSFETLPRQPDTNDDNRDDDIDFVLRNLAFTYDNALAMLAFLADWAANDVADSLRRARLIGDAFLIAQDNDRAFSDGRLRTAYAAGDLTLPPGWKPTGRADTVSIPGFYDEGRQRFFEVEQSAIDTGNNAWAALALVALHRATEEPRYLAAAVRIANFLLAFKQENGTFQGFRGGILCPEASESNAEDDCTAPDSGPCCGVTKPSDRAYASVEHNLDLSALFRALFQATGEHRWQEEMEHADAFVEAMWDPTIGCYRTGTIDKDARNELADQLPSDAQTWNVLARPAATLAHPDLLDCVKANHYATTEGFSGIDFNEAVDGVWMEGTGHLAVAAAFDHQETLARQLRNELRRAQSFLPDGDGQAHFATVGEFIDTGFGFRFYRRKHIAASAWNVFAQLGYNPFDGTFAEY